MSPARGLRADAATLPEPQPGQGSWQSVSPRLVPVRLLGILIGALVLLALTAWPLIPWALGPWRGAPLWTLLAAPALVVALAAVRALLAVRSVRAIRYREDPQELLIRRGLWTRRLVVVPYGRMQFVDVTSGPLQRALGIAELKLHTAAAASDAALPGVPAAEAERLRARLTERGEQELMAL